MENPFKKAVEEDNELKDKTAQEENINEENIEAEEASEKTEEINPLQEKYDTLNNQYIRLAADFDNYRKRQAQERESLINYGKTEALTKLLEVLDNFDRAEKTLKDTTDIDCVKEAFAVLHKQITDSLEKMGLTLIETVGKEFDPNIHDAVMQTPTEEYPDQTIIAELQKGYKLGDKVLRPSLVNVATN